MTQPADVLRTAGGPVMAEAVSVITRPTAQAVTLAEVKAHLRVEFTADDLYISELVTTAVEAITLWSGLVALQTEYKLERAAFPPGAEPLELPRGPLIGVTHVKYYDTADPPVQYTMNAALYQTWSTQTPRVVPIEAEVWPDHRVAPPAVEVQFTAGYATSTDVPHPMRQLILLLVGKWYEVREQGAPGPAIRELEGLGAASSLLDSLRLGSLRFA